MTTFPKSQPAPPATAAAKPLRPAHTGVDPFKESHEVAYNTRASLDIPREPYSVSSTAPRGGPVKKTYREYLSLPRINGQSSRQRPLSMHSTFSPPPRSPPTFLVESPRSPNPLNIDARDPSTNPNSNSRLNRAPSRGSTPSPNHEKCPPPPPPVPPVRPVRPVSLMMDGQLADRRPVVPESVSARGPPPTPTLRTVYDCPVGPGAGGAAPPVPARTSKPRIGSKPLLPPKSTGSVALAAPVTSSEERVSPFSTPPSSANNSPSRSDTESYPRPKIQARFSANIADLGFPPLQYPAANTHTTAERNGVDVRASKPAPPPPPRISREEIRPLIKFEDSIKGQRTSLDDAGMRPDLPPRPPGGKFISGIRNKVPSLRGRSYSPPRVSTDSCSESVQPLQTPSAFLPPPKRSAIKGKSPTRQPSPGDKGPNESANNATAEDSYGGYDDSDDEATDDQSPLSEYPDSSQANRRVPSFKTGIGEIPCKYDVRLFAVCGQYVCTTSRTTDVWSIESGRCIMSLNHSEGIRITAIAFKPSVKVLDEGRHLWLGTSHGELMEVDIANQRVVDTRVSAHMKKEIVQIHRSGYELWSLDDGGKLQVWAPDLNGVPNLKNSPTTFRIPNKHTFSIVADGLLWIGAGRTVHVYQPSTDSSIPFNLSARPLSPTKPTGEITCGAIVNSEPDKIYFGHIDGNVSIYSRSRLTCVDVVSISLYKINSMSGVGDYLWAGFKTGMIYVYDVRTNPWRVLKDWKCANGPVVQVVADRTSIWKSGRLQVVSLGVDNVIRLWDGMLEDDWLEGEMQKRDVEFCNFREIRVLVCSWNAGASKPQDLKSGDDAVFLKNVLYSVNSPDIIVFGFQELVDLENKKLTAKTLLKGKKKKAASQQEHMSHQYRLWQQQLTKSIETHMPRDQPYVLLHAANLVGLFTAIFVRSSERAKISNVSAATVKRGLGGLHGNKGALVIRFVIDDSSLCFINCHLAAGQSHTTSRNNDIAAILESDSLPVEPNGTKRSDIFVGGGDGTMILDHEICILNGDLNYRIDMHRDSVIQRSHASELAPLLERDQLLMERKRNPGFRLRAFQENPITFKPTYKYDVGSDTYDSSEKKRTPAWCDRLLFRGLGRVKQLDYRRWEVRASDHRPVSGVFCVWLKTVDQGKKDRVLRGCMEQYKAVRERHIWDAK